MENSNTQQAIIQEIDYNTISFLSPIISSYLNENPQLKSFYKYPVDVKAFGQVIADKSKQAIDRVLLVDVLKKQYQGEAICQAVEANINLLQADTTFTITTAHQPNLFTGFLFSVYKIIGAINAAEQLKTAYPDNNFVPVYWIGSEDHDFEEINHVYLQGEKLAWQSHQTGAVGSMDVKAVQPLIEQVAAKLAGRPHTDELITLLKQAYSQATLAKANKQLLNALFGQYGLVILDQDDAQLKQLFVPQMKAELQNGIVEKSVNPVIEQLKALNYKVQASPRAINLFYLDEGMRERIVWNESADKYEVLNSDLTFSSMALIDLLESNPEKFSPNVFLRPVYQELVLPNLAYVGGGGELAYWLELKVLFEHFDVNYPVLLLRNSVALIDKGTQKKIDKLGLLPAQLFEEEDTLIKTYVVQNTDNKIDLSQEKEQIKQLFQLLVEKAKQIDPSLENAVLSQMQGQLNALEGLEKKLMRAEKNNFETAITQIKAIKQKLFPHGKPQERYENFMPFYAQNGAAWVQELKTNIHPFNKRFSFLA